MRTDRLRSTVLPYSGLHEALGLDPGVEIVHVSSRRNPDQLVLLLRSSGFAEVDADWQEAPLVPVAEVKKKGGSDE